MASNFYLNVTGIKCLPFFGQKLEVSWLLELIKEICLFIIVRHPERFPFLVGYGWEHRWVCEVFCLRVDSAASDFPDIVRGAWGPSSSPGPALHLTKQDHCRCSLYISQDACRDWVKASLFQSIRTSPAWWYFAFSPRFDFESLF